MSQDKYNSYDNVSRLNRNYKYNVINITLILKIHLNDITL